MIDKPILITGAARSGTSLIAGIIHACGAFGGVLAKANKANQKGMFENSAIRNNVIKPFLHSIGADRMGQLPLPDRNIVRKCAAVQGTRIRRKILNILVQQGYDEKAVWFYKGAKMCLIWPLIHSAFPEAVWIVARRYDQDIIKSCLGTGFMRAYKTTEGWQKWVDEHKLCFAEMEQNYLNVTEIWSHEIINGEVQNLKAIVQQAGLQWNQEAVNAFIDPSLFMHNSGG